MPKSKKTKTNGVNKTINQDNSFDMDQSNTSESNSYEFNPSRKEGLRIQDKKENILNLCSLSEEKISEIYIYAEYNCNDFRDIQAFINPRKSLQSMPYKSSNLYLLPELVDVKDYISNLKKYAPNSQLAYLLCLVHNFDKLNATQLSNTLGYKKLESPSTILTSYFHINTPMLRKRNSLLKQELLKIDIPKILIDSSIIMREKMIAEKYKSTETNRKRKLTEDDSLQRDEPQKKLRLEDKRIDSTAKDEKNQPKTSKMTMHQIINNNTQSSLNAETEFNFNDKNSVQSTSNQNSHSCMTLPFFLNNSANILAKDCPLNANPKPTFDWLSDQTEIQNSNTDYVKSMNTVPSPHLSLSIFSRNETNIFADKASDKQNQDTKLENINPAANQNLFQPGPNPPQWNKKKKQSAFHRFSDHNSTNHLSGTKNKASSNQ